jgi:hypothetical protein
MIICAMADQHGYLDSLHVPPCDLLLHAGDVCPDFERGTAWGTSKQIDWYLTRWRTWLKRQPVKRAAVTWGNHDFITTEVDEHVHLDETVVIAIHGIPVSIWFSPWSKEFHGWAWMKDETHLAQRYDRIPFGTDIIVSHSPPYGYGDFVKGDQGKRDPHQGSKALLAAIDRVRPSIVICGHIHEGVGKSVHTVQSADSTKQHVVTIYNASVVDENYRLAREPVQIEL